MNLSQNVICPNCNHSFHLEEVFLKNLKNNLEEQFKIESQKKDSELKKLKEEVENNVKLQKENEAKFQLKLNQLDLLKKNEIDLAIQKNEISIRKSLEDEKRTFIEKEKLKIKNQIESENSELIDRYKTEAEKANTEIQKSKQFELDVLNLKKQLNSQKLDLEIEFRKQADLEKENLMALVSKREAEKYDIEFKKLQMQILDKDNQLKSVSKELDDAKRKVGQGSMQAQGETLELMIENYLINQFKDDNIKPVPKGINGADIIHEVVYRDKVCGTIIYELKRTQNFNSKDWIEKLKKDQVAIKADLAVIITDSMPKGEEESKVVFMNGVWVCHSSSYEGLCLALRDSLIRIDHQRAIQSNKGDKALELYDYLISNQFNLEITSIVDAFVSMKTLIDKEKRAMERIWKEREVQIEKVTKNTIGIYSSLRQIAGPAIRDVKELNLGNEFDDEIKEAPQLGF